MPAHGNPTGGTVAQGQASFSSSGSQFNINQTSLNALINWQSFNIASGETVNFNQPSSSSVTWNYIGNVNPSSIAGTINAIGYVILQNPNGFTVAGSATINAHGLVMTTASTPALDFSSGGPWSFDAPPPTAKIVNYGQINITGGGTAYLIASDIENNGTISAPGGKIGLYAGENVLVSMSPDGRGLSAQVTLPQGSVDNEGRLIADAGSIAAQAQTVNQNGLVQANSVKDINGTIELVAGDSMNLGSSSVISAQGDLQGTSAGGSVTIQSGNMFSDQSGSTVNVSGGAQGGNAGSVEISAPTMGVINSSILGQAAAGFTGGTLTIDPSTLLLDANFVSSINNLIDGGLSQVNIQSSGNIELSTIWDLPDEASTANLTLSAGNNITFDDSSGISAGQNWNVAMTAGTSVTSASQITPGNDGIYLNAISVPSFLQTENGNITLNAANEVIVNGGGIRTVGGGNISVTAQYGDINTGNGTSGYNFLATQTAPFYTVSSSLSGIGTTAGGNVSLTAGGDIISFPTATVADSDPGTGSFGPEAGNVTLNAGGNVYGCFVVANGAGVINAGQDIGNSIQNVALSLINGSWDLNAGQDIYLQEVRNPNGVFNDSTVYSASKHHRVPSNGNHYFDYGAEDSVTLTAGNSVNITGSDLPRESDAGVPLIMPPTLIINAGAGGVTFNTPSAADGVQLSDYDITLFPSPYGNLEITTTDGGNLVGNDAYLLMSDSSLLQWINTITDTSYTGPAPFGPWDHASVPAELNNGTPVTLNISGDMDNLILQVSKFANITVGGNMNECSFYGENLQPNQTTTINVHGQIDYQSSFTSVTLSQALPNILQASDSLPSGETFLPLNTPISWFTLLELAINPALINSQSYAGVPAGELSYYLQSALMFPGFDPSSLEYNSATKSLTVAGPLSSALLNALESPTLTLVVYGPDGTPLLDSNGHFITKTISWMASGDASLIASDLYTPSQSAPPLVGSGGLFLGGGGNFDITADSINLGNSDGILSVGAGGSPSTPFLGQVSYAFLAPYTKSGADINVEVTGLDPSSTEASLDMPASAIASLAGGNVSVISDQGSMDLGSQDLSDFEGEIMSANNLGLGIYTTAGGNINVLASGTINVDTSRIATFNGGNITVESLLGDVDCGSIGLSPVPITVFLPGAALSVPYEYTYAYGIVAETLLNASQISGASLVPGNITVITPQGNINADSGGILQLALGEALPEGPTITLEAGTPTDGNWSDPEYVGNINLGGGAIGGSINVYCTGNVNGFIFAKYHSHFQTPHLAFDTTGPSIVVASPGGSPPTIYSTGPVNGGLGNDFTPPTTATSTAASQAAAQQATQSATQQVAVNNSNDQGDDDKKKKKGKAAVRVGRVTVILSAAVPGGK